MSDQNVKVTVLKRRRFSDEDYYCAYLSPNYNETADENAVGLADLMPEAAGDGFGGKYGTFEITVKFTPDEDQ